MQAHTAVRGVERKEKSPSGSRDQEGRHIRSGSGVAGRAWRKAERLLEQAGNAQEAVQQITAALSWFDAQGWLYQNMAEDHTCKGVGECHPYREFEGMQPSR